MTRSPTYEGVWRPGVSARRVAIFAVPTAIAGDYGMNFEHMPELGMRYSYFVVLGAIDVTCAWLHFHFKKTRRL